jgi:hypothetical protein
MPGDLTPVAAIAIFLAGWCVRSLLGVLCIKVHLLAIERRLDIAAGAAAETHEIDDGAETETGAIEGALPPAGFASGEARRGVAG